jgi:simple sugar transport system ATP-binding protein
MLQLKQINKAFGSVLANKDVSIDVKRGTIHAIVGENGAGKSTIMRIAYGFYTADSGSINLDGKEVKIGSPQDAIRLGIGMVHQHFMLVDTMTVAENIVLGSETGSGAFLDIEQANKEILDLSNRLRLGVDPKALISSLSVGVQQRVELLKALYRKAEILILDEPTAVLTPRETESFFEILRDMKAEGKTVVIITHKLEEVLAISDEVTVMRDGRVVGNVETANTNKNELAKMIVGREVLLRVEKEDSKADGAANVIELKGVTVKHGGRAKLDGVSLGVRAGYIVGIAGIEGNGQTELIEVIAGLEEVSEGEVLFQERDISGLSARERKDIGIAHVPEDRHKRGLLLDSDLEENSILGLQHRPEISKSGFIDSAAVGKLAAGIIDRFDVRPADAALPAKALSGGNQQKLIIGREFSIEPKLFLAAQPTRGVDIGAIEFIHSQIIGLRDRGAAVLVVSAEIEEVTALADRLVVMYQGKIVGEVDPKTTSKDEIGLMMTGGASN